MPRLAERELWPSTSGIAAHPPRYLFDCDGWQIANPPAGLKVVDPRLAELAYASAQRAKAAVEEEDASSVYNAYSSKRDRLHLQA